jgi:hypothetical protein
MTSRSRHSDDPSIPQLSGRAILAAWSLVGLIAVAAPLAGGVFRSPDRSAPAVTVAASTAASSAADVWASIARGEFETEADRAATLEGLDTRIDETVADDPRIEPARVTAQSANTHLRICQWLSGLAPDTRRGG